MKCPSCSSVAFTRELAAESKYVWNHRWNQWRNLEIIIAGEKFRFSTYQHVPDGREKIGKLFMRMHYLCHCKNCGFEWDLLLAGDWDEKH